ncbi:GL10575 [Drosophila persimilis]|uniref:Regulatory protein zeste n=1 Tax=Drosophila persimilis TaxID=7234 RepID=B4GB70_DROPE|nr:GL10575 [Drosophila persimilis]
MDRRKKRTSSEQYQMYIDMMEADSIFATGRVPRDYDLNYLTKKWKELSDRLNKCSSGPTLTAEEWRKRLNDWKNTTRCKYRRSLMATEKDISMTTLENRALDLFGKVPSTTGETLLNLKSEKDDGDDEIEEIGQRTSAAFQRSSKLLFRAGGELVGDNATANSLSLRNNTVIDVTIRDENEV